MLATPRPYGTPASTTFQFQLPVSTKYTVPIMIGPQIRKIASSPNPQYLNG